MPIPPNPTTVILPILCLLLFLLSPQASPLSSASIVSELSVLQSQSSTGVIHLTNDLLLRILSVPTPRPFHFLIFFDARQLHSKPELALSTLRSEFSIVSSSFLFNNPDKKSHLFFFDMEFNESQDSFSRFGINALPHIRIIPPSAIDLKNDSFELDSYSGLTESLTQFIASRTKLSVGTIKRPPFMSKKQIFFASAVALIWTPFLVKKLMSGNTILHEKITWMAGAIFVYFFSVSGMMFNIIRKMPLFLRDRKDPTKILFFYQGSGLQLGAEGFSIGFLYTTVGLLLAFLTHGLVKVRNRSAQRWAMMLILFVLFWSVQKVVLLGNWKSGYRIHGYWPSSWR
ncbi:putative dolichyl-diphosphooligosaccharide--protein glycosyltransferase subunitB [Sesamum alatum]|uniref:Dolichyl-diphosphooligosaccharide--protein glycosyltransferase subunitB n=1 Tax=Sesamum alatum TaxID=300844 RepID=A0AAE2CYP6_9LAMI|nr:putative dolichyl-diphosphooligosaccharide--protein glycosyltransferase subunitB [Sesamum alatum]